MNKNETILKALRDSRLHWLENASIDKLGDAKTSSDECKLCGLFLNNCGQPDCTNKKLGRCPLQTEHSGCCVEYDAAASSRNEGNIEEFRVNALRMVERLDAKIGKLKAQPQPKFKVGDACWWDGIWDGGEKEPQLVTINFIDEDNPSNIYRVIFGDYTKGLWTSESSLTPIPQPIVDGGREKSLTIGDVFEQDGETWKIVGVGLPKDMQKYTCDERYIITCSGDYVSTTQLEGDCPVRFIVEPVVSNYTSTCRISDDKAAYMYEYPAWHQAAIGVIGGEKPVDEKPELIEGELRTKDRELIGKYKFIKTGVGTKRGDITNDDVGDSLFICRASHQTWNRYDFASESERSRYEADIAEPKVGWWEWRQRHGTKVLVTRGAPWTTSDTPPAQPATLDDLSVDIKGTKCWFAWDGDGDLALYNKDEESLGFQHPDEPKWLEDYAERLDAPVICQEQWDSLRGKGE